MKRTKDKSELNDGKTEITESRIAKTKQKKRWGKRKQVSGTCRSIKKQN